MPTGTVRAVCVTTAALCPLLEGTAPLWQHSLQKAHRAVISHEGDTVPRIYCAGAKPAVFKTHGGRYVLWCHKPALAELQKRLLPRPPLTLGHAIGGLGVKPWKVWRCRNRPSSAQLTMNEGLVPESFGEFRSVAFWDGFFKARKNKAFEWYGEWLQLQHLLKLLLSPGKRVLVVGCGNSELSADMCAHALTGASAGVEVLLLV